MRVCSCPASAVLPSLPNYDCPADFGQVRKLAVMRLRKADGTLNSFTTSAPITALASWSAKLAATDGEKVVITPEIYGLSDSGGDPITWGSGNEVPGGIPQVVGANPVTESATFRHLPQNIVKAMRALECEAAGGNLGIIPINENGQFEAIQDATTATTYYPIPVRSFFIGPKVHGGLQEPDSNAVSWSLEPNWSDDVVIVTPEFDALTLLVNPA